MNVETWIKIEYEDMLGDDFGDDNPSKKVIRDAVEQHIQDYCDEHNIDRSAVKIIE